MLGQAQGASGAVDQEQLYPGACLMKVPIMNWARKALVFCIQDC